MFKCVKGVMNKCLQNNTNLYSCILHIEVIVNSFDNYRQLHLYLSMSLYKHPFAKYVTSGTILTLQLIQQAGQLHKCLQ